MQPPITHPKLWLQLRGIMQENKQLILNFKLSKIEIFSKLKVFQDELNKYVCIEQELK